mmetsp:Transcript_118/g.476  ORF Transcript_118/g.476 Transcript_118/m.476 type:complete len:317 (-) Transcript_118:1563-2513(-)
MSTQCAYAVRTSAPGPLTVLPDASGAAMDKESLPPSTATWTSISASHMAEHAAYIFAPSPGSLAAHIQLAERRMSCLFEIRAKQRFVIISATETRAMRSGDRFVSCGASPTAMAQPSVLRCDRAMTAQFDSGSCSGPTHCCLAISPPTDLSTLCTRNRFEQTLGRPSTAFKAWRRSSSRPFPASGLTDRAGVSLRKVFGGNFSMTNSSGRSEIKASLPPGRSSMTRTVVSFETTPTTSKRHFSRSHNARSAASSRAWSRIPLDSWYSAPQISKAVMVSSPTLNFESLYSAPAPSTISFSTFALPPQPWSWMAAMGF